VVSFHFLKCRYLYLTRSPFVAGVVLGNHDYSDRYLNFYEKFLPNSLDRIQAAYALGATRWAMIKAVVIPYGRSGVVGGAMLGLGMSNG